MENHHHTLTSENEKRTLAVIIFTLIAMAAEILYGYYTNSMALLADGYHMGTHALALSLTYIAYVLSRKLAHNHKFEHGTDKIGTLAAYTSSLFLGLTGIWIIIEAFIRFLNPLNIMFNEAILVAIIGLIVNAACIFIMEGNHKHIEHSDEKCDAHNKDYNFLAAYYHILADALTSILAIIALLVGKYFGINALDSIVGFLGGILILKWAFGLLKNTIKILIDMKE